MSKTQNSVGSAKCYQEVQIQLIWQSAHNTLLCQLPVHNTCWIHAFCNAHFLKTAAVNETLKSMLLVTLKVKAS